MTRRRLAKLLGTVMAGTLGAVGVIVGRPTAAASLDGAERRTGISPDWAYGPMTLQDLHDLTGGLLNHGIPPETPVVSYVDGRPSQPGPAVLRRLTWIKPEGVVPAGDRLHLIRHTGGPGMVEVVTLG